MKLHVNLRTGRTWESDGEGTCAMGCCVTDGGVKEGEERDEEKWKQAVYIVKMKDATYCYQDTDGATRNTDVEDKETTN